MTPDTTRSQAERLARLYCELWSSGDVNIVDQIFPPGAQHVAGNEQPWGEFITALRKDFPNLSRPLEETYFDGDTLIIRTRMQGTHSGGPGYFNYPATGTRMDISAVTAFRVADGLLAEECWSEYDLGSVERSMASGVVRRYLEAGWGEGDEAVLKSHVASGYVMHLDGKSASVEGRRRLAGFIRDSRKSWDEGVFQVSYCEASGDWGETVHYRWAAGEEGEDRQPVLAQGTAAIRNGVVSEEWIHIV